MSAATILRGVTSGNSGSAATTTTAITVTAPAGVTSGDQLIVMITLRTETNATWRSPAGWALQSNPTALSAGDDYMYTATYGADVTGTSWTWDAGASNTVANKYAWGCLALIGSQVGGLSTKVTGADSTAATTHTAGPLTTSVSTYLVGLFGDRASGTTWTWPAGWVKEIDTQSTGTNATSVTIGLDDTTPVAAGTYSVAVTPSASDTAWWGLFAYAQASSGTAATASGTVTLDGSVSAAASASASGSIALGGTASTQAPVSASGVIALSGAVTGNAAATASGLVSLSGTANATSGNADTFQPHTYVTFAPSGNDPGTFAPAANAVGTFAPVGSQAATVALAGDGTGTLALTSNGASTLALAGDGAGTFAVADQSASFTVQTTT